jgi:hypothetical protein
MNEKTDAISQPPTLATEPNAPLEKVKEETVPHHRSPKSNDRENVVQKLKLFASDFCHRMDDPFVMRKRKETSLIRSPWPNFIDTKCNSKGIPLPLKPTAKGYNGSNKSMEIFVQLEDVHQFFEASCIMPTMWDLDPTGRYNGIITSDQDSRCSGTPPKKVSKGSNPSQRSMKATKRKGSQECFVKLQKPSKGLTRATQSTEYAKTVMLQISDDDVYAANGEQAKEEEAKFRKQLNSGRKQSKADSTSVALPIYFPAMPSPSPKMSRPQTPCHNAVQERLRSKSALRPSRPKSAHWESKTGFSVSSLSRSGTLDSTNSSPFHIRLPNLRKVSSLFPNAQALTNGNRHSRSQIQEKEELGLLGVRCKSTRVRFASPTFSSGVLKGFAHGMSTINSSVVFMRDSTSIDDLVVNVARTSIAPGVSSVSSKYDRLSGLPRLEGYRNRSF